MSDFALSPWITLDPLALLMIALVGCIGTIVVRFTTTYLKGDARYKQCLITMVLLIIAVMVTVSADHLLLLFAGWSISNVLLVRLMIHKPSWRAARASGMLSLYNYAVGSVSLAVACWLLYRGTGETSVHAILAQPDIPYLLPVLVLILITAMTQSAIWPFHRWLLSSLNSPTPVSALMHAGLVNGGGFLLVRFAPLYLQSSLMLTMMLALGIVTALLGTCWKLIQSDIKRMLACSTMSQMGFMLIQCGLGLYPAAVAHICFHGLFKAYLFLASGSAATEKRFSQHAAPNAFTAILALCCGSLATAFFIVTGPYSWHLENTTFFILMMVTVAGTQTALSILDRITPIALLKAATLTGVMGGIYGLNIRFIEQLLSPLNIMQPQPLTLWHAVGLVLLVGSWILLRWHQSMPTGARYARWADRAYVHALNASQPHARTITAHRNHYSY